MKIYNIRLGHACNSSSTHSIVPLAGGAEDSEYEGYNEFGWDFFTLGSEQAKMRYLAATLDGCGVEAADITRITGVERIPKREKWDYEFGYVDHQSRLSLPVPGKHPHAEEFLADIVEFFKLPEIVVLGGNDNTSESHHLLERAVGGELPIATESAAGRLRSDVAPDGSRYWTSLRPWSGDRVRFSLDNMSLEAPAYSSVPELVDFKVTDYCPFDCPWCYQGSTLDGKHVERQTAMAWLNAFIEAEVFEIALGGGEPTLWLHLREFIDAANAGDINVNLTTKNLKWVADGEGLLGLSAVAISINNPEDLGRLQQLNFKEIGAKASAKAVGYHKVPEFTVQCVPAFCDDELLRGIVDWCFANQKRVTFLGVKRTGRAAEEKRQDDLRWLEAVKPHLDHWWARRGVAVDTLMAKAAKPVFDELGVEPIWYETEEGKFSCYVDGLTGDVAPSSYTPVTYMPRCYPERLSGENFKLAYQIAQEVAGIRPKHLTLATD